MKTSQAGKAFIAKNEGDCLTSKPDTTRNQIGHGHNLTSAEQETMSVYGIGVSNGITLDQADFILDLDVAKVDAAMNAQHLALDLNQNQWDAVSDWVYNLGAGHLVDLLSHGVEDIPNQLPRWNRAGGNVLPGLVARRAAEVTLYNMADPCECQRNRYCDYADGHHTASSSAVDPLFSLPRIKSQLSIALWC